MTELSERHCKPCEGDTEALSPRAACDLLSGLADGWRIDDDGKSILREFSFKGFYRTMGFVNAVAWVANMQGHHPDLEVGYGRCLVRFTTHAIDALSENDFICAARIDALTA